MYPEEPLTYLIERSDGRFYAGANRWVFLRENALRYDRACVAVKAKTAFLRQELHTLSPGKVAPSYTIWAERTTALQ